MRTRRRQRRHDEDEIELLERPRVANEPSPADRALDLQRTAGNHAVGAALDRWALPWVPAAPQWPKERQVIFDGTAIPLLSFSFGGGESAGAGGGPGRASIREATVSVPVGTHSSEFSLATAEGRPFAKVVIVTPKGESGVTITLTDVLIASATGSGEMQTLQLNFGGDELSSSPPQP